MMIDDMLTPTGYPPPPPTHTAADMAHSAHSQHCGHTALPTQRVEDKTPADAPTPPNRSMLTPYGGPVQGQRRQSADIKGDVCSSTLNRFPDTWHSGRAHQKCGQTRRMSLHTATIRFFALPLKKIP